jgi:hypothetical protein
MRSQSAELEEGRAAVWTDAVSVSGKTAVTSTKSSCPLEVSGEVGAETPDGADEDEALSTLSTISF